MPVKINKMMARLARNGNTRAADQCLDTSNDDEDSDHPEMPSAAP
jgi:hypothetical protein